MNKLPQPIFDHIFSITAEDRSPAYIILNKDSKIEDFGGDLEKYGIQNLNIDNELNEDLYFLSDFFPIINNPVFLPTIKLGSNIPVDIHLFSTTDQNCVLLLDASATESQQGLVQQIANDIRLIRNKKAKLTDDEIEEESVLPKLLSVLDIVILERNHDKSFKIIGGITDWFVNLFHESELNIENIQLEKNFLFLENFLIDADEFWLNNKSGFLKSGPWVETDINGKETYLESTVFNLENKNILLIELSRTPLKDKHTVLQKARERTLEYYNLDKEIQKKEILIHCIVHDLTNPVTIIKNYVNIFLEYDLPKKLKEPLNAISQQSLRLERLVDEILDVFSADIESLRTFKLQPNLAPEIYKIVSEIVDSLKHTFAERGVELVFDSNNGNTKIIGEEFRLQRVLTNLLDNALRYSPRDSRVIVGIKEEEEKKNTVLVTIDDEGPGIDSKLSENLFQKFSQGSEKAGKKGLGLYFCRITIERWGGKIGHSNREEGGSRFWFTLSKLD